MKNGALTTKHGAFWRNSARLEGGAIFIESTLMRDFSSSMLAFHTMLDQVPLLEAQYSSVYLTGTLITKDIIWPRTQTTAVMLQSDTTKLGCLGLGSELSSGQKLELENGHSVLKMPMPSTDVDECAATCIGYPHFVYIPYPHPASCWCISAGVSVVGTSEENCKMTGSKRIVSSNQATWYRQNGPSPLLKIVKSQLQVFSQSSCMLRWSCKRLAAERLQVQRRRRGHQERVQGVCLDFRRF